jgi:hypothetical protein
MPVDVDDCTRRCRCQDPEGKMWIYLNAFCRFRDSHKPLEDYGFPMNSTQVTTIQYHEDFMSGVLNDQLEPHMRPGYRPTKVGF